jgi:hypothetical protein
VSLSAGGLFLAAWSLVLPSLLSAYSDTPPQAGCDTRLMTAGSCGIATPRITACINAGICTSATLEQCIKTFYQSTQIGLDYAQSYDNATPQQTQNGGSAIGGYVGTAPCLTLPSGAAIQAAYAWHADNCDLNYLACDQGITFSGGAGGSVATPSHFVSGIGYGSNCRCTTRYTFGNGDYGYFYADGLTHCYASSLPCWMVVVYRDAADHTNNTVVLNDGENVFHTSGNVLHQGTYPVDSCFDFSANPIPGGGVDVKYTSVSATLSGGENFTDVLKQGPTASGLPLGSSLLEYGPSGATSGCGGGGDGAFISGDARKVLWFGAYNCFCVNPSVPVWPTLPSAIGRLNNSNPNIWTYQFPASGPGVFTAGLTDICASMDFTYTAKAAFGMQQFSFRTKGSIPSPTFTPSPTFSVSPSFTVSSSFTSTATSSPSFTPSATFTASPSSTSTATPSPSFTATPSGTPSAFVTATSSPTLAATPSGPCSPEIKKLVVVSNPSQSSSDRMVSLRVGDCVPDKVMICVYTVSMVQVVCWTDSDINPNAQWIHEQFKKAGIELAPGTYYVKASAYHQGQLTTAVTTFVVLPG